MSITHEVKSIGNTATRVGPAIVHSGVDFTIQNISDVNDIFLGDSNVTTVNYGFKLFPRTALSIELDGHDTMYAISSASATNVAIMYADLEY